MKTVFFGWVDLEEFGNVDEDELFYHDGDHYWYKVVLEEDQISIHDTCGRMIPLGYEHVDGLYRILKIVRNNQAAKSEADRSLEENIRQLHDSML